MFRILQRPTDCRGCPLDRIADAFSDCEGTCANGVLLIGESLGYHEAEAGYPFRPHAPAGSVLDRAIRMIGTSREQYGLWNLVACRPPANELNGASYEREAIEHCKVHFNKVVKRFRPKVIVALGAVPTRVLTGMAGEKQTLDYLRGYPIWNAEYKCFVVGSYHPSYVVRGAWPVLQVLCRDLKKAIDVSKNGVPKLDLHYIEHGTEDNLVSMYKELEANPDVPVSLDIETEYSKEVDFDTFDVEDEAVYLEELAKSKKQELTQLNISLDENEGMVCSVLPAHKRVYKAICELPNPKVGHNFWLFDKPVLEMHDIGMGGTILDGIWSFHHLYPDLPGVKGKMSDTGMESDEDGSLANLQYVSSFYDFPFPWKHMAGERPEFYGIADVDSALRGFWGMRREMEQLGILEGYYTLVCDMMPVLERMRKRGIPVNRQTLVDLHNYLTGEIATLDVEIQKCIPPSLFPTSPKDGYKKLPTVKCAACGGSGCKPLVFDAQALLVVVDGDEPVKKKRVKKVKDCSDCLGTGRVEQTINMVQREFLVEGGRTNCKCYKIRRKNLEYFAQSEFAQVDETGRLRAPDPECMLCNGTGSLNIETHKEMRWANVLPFLVSSPQQMFGYAHHKKHEVPKNSKKKYAMDQETVDKLAKKYKDPLYTNCTKQRKLKKLDSTYALGWMPDADGCVHSSVAFFPATQQLSSRRPNSQNQPNVQKQGELALRFARAIEAKAGHKLVSADWKSFHAQTLGWCAQDPSYIRLAKIDIHSYLATWLLKIEHREQALEWSAGELKDWLNWYKKNYTMKDGTPFKTVRDKQAKPGILGYGFGLGGEKLYKLNEDSFENVTQAIDVLTTLDRTFPKVAIFRANIPVVAKKANHLKTAYGSIRWFFDIQRYNFRMRRMDHGGDWEKAIAYLPAASAFGHCKETMVVLDTDANGSWEDSANERFGLINQVHDELMWRPKVEDVEECLHTIKPVMERQSRMLMPWDDNKGLSVEVECKVGNSRADMEEVHV